jgi:hypothetical protein
MDVSPTPSARALDLTVPSTRAAPACGDPGHEGGPCAGGWVTLVVRDDRS